MRFRLSTLLILILALAIGLGWWRDHTTQARRLDLQSRQIKQLQQQVDVRTGVFVSSNIRFKTPEQLVEFVKRARDDEFNREDWSAWGNSYVAEQSVAQLAELASFPNDDTRLHAVWLLGLIGRNKRPLKADPIAALLGALDDPSSRVRANAFHAIGQFGPLATEALPKLREIMRRDQSQDAYFATMAIKEINPSEDIGFRLRELFLMGEKGVWKNVAFRLPDNLPPGEAKQLLLAKAELETDAESRETLAQAMNKIRD
jgi:hypothetical protein